MGKILDKKFERRFGGRIVLIYASKTNHFSTAQKQNVIIATAFETIQRDLMRKKMSTN